MAKTKTRRRKKASTSAEKRPKVPVFPPPARRLRVFAFDPSLSTLLETAGLNEVTLPVFWEGDPKTGQSTLQPGPIGEYLEVIDVDPASDCFYEPVNLDHPALLAQDGLAPSEGNPQFHQQMVYAVAMTTIRNFESALGRAALWSPRFVTGPRGQRKNEFVQRLRIYPHALREANAYYSPAKRALLFGYFPASMSDPGENLPGGTVFTCLSHDIVAHETTHALLDGMHRRFIEPSNPDSLALHEAFADIVALFQHFSFPEVLRHQIAKTRGDLTSENLLSQLARQFGQAIGRYGALRDAIGTVDAKTKAWKLHQPDATELDRTFEPHTRGAILVAAVFDAFLSIYKSRIADLLRIATSGTGVLPAGNLHPDLVTRLAREASTSAQHILGMCIRALDYCPPVDVTFGNYLRALITADEDLVPNDDRGYRLAVIDAFRRRGIYPLHVRSLSVESLRWHVPTEEEQKEYARLISDIKQLRTLLPDWGLSSNRATVYEQMRLNCKTMHDWITERGRTKARNPILEHATGLRLDQKAERTIPRDRFGWPRFEVHAVRPARRLGPDGDKIIDLVIEITQRRRGYLDPKEQKRADRGQGKQREPDFVFRGGCTLLVDLVNGRVRHAICKKLTSDRRLEAQRQYLTASFDRSLQATYFRDSLQYHHDEPFALLHRALDEEEELS